MKKKGLLFLVSIFTLLLFLSLTYAQKQAPESMILQVEGGKLAPVPFPHSLHTEKAKIDCAKCHHKEKDPTQPEKCIKCHPVTDAPPNVPAFKDAYHKQCIDCHKEVVAKGSKAPTKCAECHKK